MKNTNQDETRRRRFAVCVRNDGYEGSLDLGKVYLILSDPKAAKYGRIRVIDNEDEDYLYPVEYFLPVRMSKPVKEAMSAA